MLLKNAFSDDRITIATIMIICTVMIFLLMDLNSINPDETNSLMIGRNMTEGGYGMDFSHRLPLIPAFISGSIALTGNVALGRYVIPILFMNLLLLGTFLLGKELYGRQTGAVSAVVVLSFFLFWRWGLSILTDVPIAVSGTLFLLFFYIGFEKDTRFFYPAALALAAGLLLKQSVLLFAVSALLYIAYRRDLKPLRTREFLIGMAAVPVIFLAAYLVFNALFSASMMTSYQMTFFTVSWDISEILKLALAPVVMFSAAGVLFGIKRGRKEDVFAMLGGLAVFLFFILSGHLRLRYFVSLVPFMGITASVALLELRKKERLRAAATALFTIMLAYTFINAVYMAQLEETTLWGAEELRSYVDSIEGDVTVATAYLPYYLEATSSKDIRDVVVYYDFGDMKLEFRELYDILGDMSHPDHGSIFRRYSNGDFESYRNFDHGWFKENGVDYVILSAYKDYERSGRTDYFSPPVFLGLFKRAYTNGRIPPDFEFESDVYKSIDGDPRFEREGDVRKGSQTVFISYRVL